MTVGEKTCLKCGVKHPATKVFFSPQPKSKTGLHSYCKKCCAASATARYRADINAARIRSRKARRNNPVKWLKYGARARAKKRGLPCTIEDADIFIPRICPVLGIRLVTRGGQGKSGGRKDSATLDCLVPEKGYVPGNVCVISHRANMIKTNATEAELAAVLRYVRGESNGCD